MKFSAVVLAAGEGARMQSRLPKVLHLLAGKPMVKRVIDTCNALGAQNIYLVYGHGGALIQKVLSKESVHWVLQGEQLGTGHALFQASYEFGDDETILVLYGDVPLVTEETITNLLKAQPVGGIALLTVILEDPVGYGRVIRSNRSVVAVIEQKDANEEQKLIKEVNTGVMVATGRDLKRWLTFINHKNSQDEYYLTDIIATAYNEGSIIQAIHPISSIEVQGVNNRLQLVHLERAFQLMQASKLLDEGVMIHDITRFDLRGELLCGVDCEIDINVLIEGNVFLGDNVIIGAGSVLKDCKIDNNTIIQPYSIIERATVSTNCVVGPFGRLRPGSELLNGARVGNFVELKNTRLGEESKANHLTYLGDTEIGQRVNVGAGVITCNYDGAEKHKTIISDDVFVGSASQLIAPIHIADRATIAAGTTLTKDVKEGELVITRSKERKISDWKRPSKKK
ncbi:bifunctional protein GlmU [Candidatus Photodesmus blepharus]|uniref:Bifunctional protein GlmU n=1 Tax=Candidatus Photodesmus blepharonis TaxID=1179155 RepID=A0A084CNN2_9GAMM|nr:bifunctional UDP-N-acetylglucosamine diphosphorylase/glucosamine-1-phosphate N-acetyltransferase GlmU [Candidatus Photodesmus blepharus]KEY91411.1 bifunctional protein GlmU [Candidatus Photodesmus blepharus]